MKLDSINNITFRANKMSSLQARLIDEELASKKSVDIICHSTTDKDSANCGLLMWEYLKQKGINSRIIISQDKKALGLRNEDSNIVQANTITEDEKPADCAFCVDFSASGRVDKNVLNLIKNSPAVLCFDHHENQDLFENPVILKTNNEENNAISLNYIDTTAKSATSIIYRFFEALNQEIDENQAYDIFSGFVSDCTKKGIISCDGEKGTITPKRELIEDENAYEIYLDLASKVSESKKIKLAKEIDIMSSLSPKEKELCRYLSNNLSFSKNKKVAFVEIPKGNKLWEDLGKDNPRTSTILNRFRQKVLNENKDIQAAIVFYEAGESYRLSVHSKCDLKDFYELSNQILKDKFELLSIGGHSNRGGGKIDSKSKEDCAEFTRDIIICANETIK